MPNKSAVQPAQVFQFFRDCYEADHETLLVSSIFKSQFKLKHILKGDEVLLEKSERFAAFDHQKAAEVKSELELNALDKELVYSAFYILGKDHSGFGKETNLASPLFMIPAVLKGEEELTLELQRENLKINIDLLRKLDLREPSRSHDGFIEKAEAILSREGGVYGIKGLVEEFYSNVDTSALIEWPKLWSGAKTQKAVREAKNDGQYILSPTAAYLILDKNQNTLGVLNDLKLLAEENKFAPPLKALFEVNDPQTPGAESWWKSNLNIDQYQGLKNAFEYKNSIIIGPPGTGKSYTIANIAAEAISRQEKVLIASRNKPAVEVIRRILEREFALKDYLVQTSSRYYRSSLNARINRFLSGIGDRLAGSGPPAEGRLNYHQTTINEAESLYYKELNKELRRLDLGKKQKLNLPSFLEKIWLSSSIFQKKADFLKYYLDLLEHRMQLQKEVKKYAKLKIRHSIYLNRNSHRSTIVRYQEALQSENFTQLKKILEDLEYEKLLDVFPIWLVHLSELNNVLPQKQEIFDLVIIDEASQVDIAQALPAIQRAKRVVIVGDSQQLRHYSFLSRNKQRQFREKRGLPNEEIFNYRDNSILDLYLKSVQEQDQVSFLREHFRSSPLLIGFSNQEFYEGQLQVLKATPSQLMQEHIEVHGTKGLRNKEGINELEARKLMVALRKIIRRCEKDYLKTSIGILSPFSAQTRHLSKLIKSELDPKIIKRHDITVGGPYNFQGSERDIMLLSFAVDDQSHPSAFIHLNKAEVFNVSISRAKSKLLIFHSLEDRKQRDSLLHRYLDYIDSHQPKSFNTAEQDQFAKEVRRALKRYSGYEISYEAQNIGGMTLDVLVRYKGDYYFIDLIGFPGDYEGAYHLHRYHTLSRVGIHSIPLLYSFWKKDPEQAKRSLINSIKDIRNMR